MKRIAMISEHASPLAMLGGVDAGGQNVYVGQLARHLAAIGYEVDVITRRDSPLLPETAEWAHGVRIVHVPAKVPAAEAFTKPGRPIERSGRLDGTFTTRDGPTESGKQRRARCGAADPHQRQRPTEEPLHQHDDRKRPRPPRNADTKVRKTANQPQPPLRRSDLGLQTCHGVTL